MHGPFSIAMSRCWSVDRKVGNLEIYVFNISNDIYNLMETFFGSVAVMVKKVRPQSKIHELMGKL